MIDCTTAGEVPDPFHPTDPARCRLPMCSDQPGTTPYAPLGWDSPVTVYICVDNTPENPNECDPAVDPAGFVAGVPVCQDELDDCVEEGGDTAMFNGEQSCFPSDNELEQVPTIPTCRANEILTLTQAGGTETWSCEPLEREPPDPENPPEEPECTDTDSDGLCNDDDSDIDNDGEPNSTDDDDDGDGLDDDDDGNPNGDGEGQGGGEDSSVSGGGNCSEEPECKGDAVQCAIVYQTYKTRCETLRPETQEELDREIADDTVESLEQPDEDMQDALSNVFNQTGGGGSCPSATSITVADRTFDINYGPICDLAAMIKPFMIMMASLAGFLIVLRAF